MTFLHDWRLAVSGENRLAFVVGFRDLRGVGLKRLRRVVGLEILNHALRYEKQREHDADRHEHVVGGAHDIGPEIADRLRGMACDAADQRSSDTHADGR